MDKFSYLDNTSAAFIEELYQKYQTDPQSIDKSWQRFFEGYEYALTAAESGAAMPAAPTPVPMPASGDNDSGVGADGVPVRDKEVAVMKLITAYRDRGHLIAHTNPVRPRRFHSADLNLEYFGLNELDLDMVMDVGHQLRLGQATLRDIVSHLRRTYCGSIGVEYRYIPESRVRQWLHREMESTANHPEFTNDFKRRVFTQLAQACGFERFLHVKYVGQKRFSLEGCESVIPALDAVFQEGGRLGVKEFTLGMAHRGRLNVLVNLFGKSYANVFSEFEGSFLPSNVSGDGDVKYHQGHSADVVLASGNKLHLSLMANPSHLEAVDPVVLGSTRAKGERLYHGNFKEIVPVLIHGDAAISGQGVVYEVCNLSLLEGYSTGGTIHIVLNNQVGFTANYRETRSSLYCTDIAKVTECPVFHVNADDPLAVAHVAQMAVRLRQEFGIDVYIDILGYRRYGHNEADDPNFTQPLLYKAISRHKSVLELLQQQMIDDNVLTEDEAKQISAGFQEQLQEDLDEARKTKPDMDVNFLGRQWSSIRRATRADFEASPETGVSRRRLMKFADVLVTVPGGFTIYPKLRRIIDARRKLVFEENQVDWGLAELMAYASLLVEGVPVRLSGQDCRRGTFAHRHAVLIDANDETEYLPLNHIQKDQEKCQIYNSHLSELGVLGFEYGYSLAQPRGLVLWEAQFGDFANGAQVIIDQFISSSESKWQRMSGIVLLLPHGHEGQGPEHSSARLLRFLDLCAELNLIVVNPTTPASFFHLLRRQVHAPYRKPLVVMSPKSLLRHPLCRSDLSELTNGRFREVIDDPLADPAKVTRVLMCTGKVYFDLLERQRSEQREDVAIVRFEQLYPFAEQQDQALVDRYTNAVEWIWVQEEAENMGAWSTMSRRLHMIDELQYVAREESASPATGSYRIHKLEQQALVDAAFEALGADNDD